MNELKQKMIYSKQTKNTFVYVSADDDKPLIPALYLSKDKMPAEAPEQIEVTIK